MQVILCHVPAGAQYSVCEKHLELLVQERRLDPAGGRAANHMKHCLLLFSSAGLSLVVSLVILLLPVGPQMLRKHSLVEYVIAIIVVRCYLPNVFCKTS